MLRKIRTILEMIKFEHTVFALPFALMAMLMAAEGWPTWWQFGWILVAMVGARSSALAFNRVVDLEYDRLNPRTANWALPRGALTRAQVWAFIIITAGIFVMAAGMLNRLALSLSPLALAIIWGYSYSKRFTTWSHLMLGLCLGIAPVGAWIGVRGEFGLPALVLAGAVMLWTAGFDIIYACQDLEFDRKFGLYSLPSRVGLKFALGVSGALHLLMLALLVWLKVLGHLGTIYLIGVAVVAAILFYEHLVVTPRDLSRVNAAFFTANGMVSIGLLAFTAADLLLR